MRWKHTLCVLCIVAVRSGRSLNLVDVTAEDANQEVGPPEQTAQAAEQIAGPLDLTFDDSSLNRPDWPDDCSGQLTDGDRFDYIVVGAGAGGAAAAGRLVLNGFEVLLVEAGGNPNVISRIPQGAMGNLESPLDWAYRTISNNVSCMSSFNDQCRFSRGKVLGGSTSINYMMYVRGNREDYDSWNWEGWSWEDLEPYFLKYEGFRQLNRLPETSESYHNTDGIVKIGFFQDSENSWHNRTIQGLETLQFPFNPDINAESQIGVTQVAGYTFNGERESTATAYLVDERVKEVLKVAKHTLCTGLIVDEQKVVRGIKVQIKDSKKDILLYANNEVILSAGTIGNPQILMLSGIGPADHLEEMGIPVVADLPVGNNMSDHVLALTFAKVDRGFEPLVSPFVTVVSGGDSAIRWAQTKDGPLASNGLTDVTALFNINCYDFYNQQLVNNRPECRLADTQLIFAYIDQDLIPLGKPVVQNLLQFESEVVEQLSKANTKKGLIVFSPIVLQPRSKGRVRLKSLDPRDDPAIYPNFLDENEDAEQLVAAIHVLKHLTQSKVFQEYGAELVTLEIPGCPEPDVDCDDYWRCYVRHLTYSVYHAAGTVHGAVTPRLQVKGVSNLRVADLSVVPYVPRGNTAAISIAVGERLAAFILEETNKK